MSPPASDLFQVQDIARAGRGVVAEQLVPAGTVLLRAGESPFHVVFRHYRKEVCTQCFLYDRGRTLPVRATDVGKVFCTTACCEYWTQKQGEVGVAAWKALERFVQDKRPKASALHESAKPRHAAIVAKWQETEGRANVLRAARQNAASVLEGRAAKRIQNECCSIADPDILSYFLSGLLSFHLNSRQDDVVDLAMENEPYKDELELQTHCNAFLQLTIIIPRGLLPSLTAAICLDAVRAGHHNAFGIRSGSDDNEEYMGYAVWPRASYFNHSCNPNVSKKRVGRTWEFWANRAIAVGEECCISYLGGDERQMTVAERRGRLGEHWDFECRCARCASEAPC